MFLGSNMLIQLFLAFMEFFVIKLFNAMAQPIPTMLLMAAA